MTILLHNLLARAPKLNDARSVAELLTVCDTLEGGMSHYAEEDILANWQQPDFNLATDAWIIATYKGQLVGYATLFQREHVHIQLQTCVHPHYRGRGIGTLLLRLAEVRARQHVRYAPPSVRVSLISSVNSSNAIAQDLLEHEGYVLVSHFWRIVIETVEDPLQTLDASQRQCTHKVVRDVNYSCATGTTRTYEPSGLYTVCEYHVFEKELRAGVELDKGEALNTQLITA